jgi:DNA-binding NtrC family response regulator
MIVLARGTRLTVRDLPSTLRDAVGIEAPRLPWRSETGHAGSPASMHDAERIMIYAALKKLEGNRTKAAAQLGISRRTLQRKLKEYGKTGTDVPASPAPTSPVS